MKVYRASIAFMTLGLGLTASHVWPQPGPSLPLVVERTAVIDRQVSVTVRNIGSRTITAWGVRGRVTYTNGASEVVEMFSDGSIGGFRDGPADTARTFASGSTVIGGIGSRLRDSVVSGISISPAAVVFDDGPAVGDEQVIRRVFALRGRERRALHLVDTVLSEEVSQRADAWSAITAAQRRLDEVADDEIRQSVAYRNVRRNLSLAFELDGENRINLGERLRHIKEDMRTRRAAADRHHERR